MNALIRTLFPMPLWALAISAAAQCPGILPKFSWASNGSSLVFTDETDVFASERVWDFGDGDTASGQIETHTYTFAGDDTVTLSLTVNGCLFSTSARVVHPGQSEACYSQLASAFATEQTGNNQLLFTDQSAGDSSFLLYLWTFGDDSISGEQNPEHFYTLPGAYNVSHSIGTVDSLFQTACVAGSARRVFVDGNTSTCDSSLLLNLLLTTDGNSIISSAEATVFNPDLVINTWGWEYGDGSAMDITGMPEAQHYYPLGGDVQTCVQVWATDTANGVECFARNCITLHLTQLVGVEETPPVQELHARPVPFNDELWIEGVAVRRGARWRLLDVLGREARSGTFSQDKAEHLTSGTWPTGIYTLVVPLEHGVSALRLLKR